MPSIASVQATTSGRRSAGPRYILLFVPCLAAWLFYQVPLVSYAIAWSGSWVILGLSMTGYIKPLPNDRPVHRQVVRPLFLLQAIFAAYYCLTSVFYVWDLMSGATVAVPLDRELRYVAAAQRYYLLGHAAFVTGILAAMDYERSGTWTFRSTVRRSTLVLALAAGAFLIAVVLSQIPGLGQFVGKLRRIAGIGAILGFALAIRDTDWTIALVGGAAFGAALISALLSGWKEEIIVVVGLLPVFLFPKYKRGAIVLGAAAVLFLATVVPAYNSVFRQLSWSQELDAQQAAITAYEQIKTGQVEVGQQGWHFLTSRASEIKHFVDYVEHTPNERPYYGLSIVEQSVYNIIPRVFWPEKPSMEALAMERAYENQVAFRASGVSAKPQSIADGYLSGGTFGVFLTGLILGLLASWGSRLSERWFGGYLIGGQVVFLGLFEVLVTTNSFEFLVNNVFWSFVLLVLLFFGLQFLGLLQPTYGPSARREESLGRAPSPTRV